MYSFPFVLCKSCLLETTFRTSHCITTFAFVWLRFTDFDFRTLRCVLGSVEFCYGFNRVFMLTTCNLCKKSIVWQQSISCMPLQNGLRNLNFENFVGSPFRNFTGIQHSNDRRIKQQNILFVVQHKQHNIKDASNEQGYWHSTCIEGMQ